LNRELVADLQESGVAAPSTTVLDGKVAIRAALFNHRTTKADVDALIGGIEAVVTRRMGERSATHHHAIDG
jgi:hypothetical protein